MSLQIVEDYPLTRCNTLGFHAVAERFVEIASLDQLQQALQLADQQAWPLLVLGGGSNLILADRLPGLVVRLENRGIELLEEQGGQLLVEVAAGESWHGLVESALQRGWHGLENLALIPGTVGAAPIQNIGAYGVELKDNMVSLTAWDRQQQRLIEFGNDDCGFGYRWSRFKGEDAGRYIIWSVRFRLSRTPVVNLAYRALAEQLAADGIVEPTPQQLFDTIVAIRRSKLPDPAQLGNAGSFFENPIVEQSVYEALKGRFPRLVAFPDKPGHMKLAAGWLIDQAGWKGYRQGAVGVYDRQALVLVNHGGGDRQQLLALAGSIQRSVQQTFGVQLQIEPRLYPQPA
ncbi:UDP-N-acetylmuramate dehydrogenase [Marinobacterium arenosum]|uniref:UDP-N-acetylmuramate dehydrogenase n=1 Tax=Marinobacterium arenosum TaxID=2862496 RepID=UPI001C95B9AC|nr:UDP-N-acetylmuramate dehydrogenase [Marinobacterium arenosum]MBY4675261.1 UDP-N-acetylmuramate dehydrogenase [Marinobacterium arenosum]